MPWRLRTRRLRARRDGVRWMIDCRSDDDQVTVWADVTDAGRLIGLQAEDIGTTGNDELDRLVAEHVLDQLAARSTAHALDDIDRRPWRRSDRLRWAA